MTPAPRSPTVLAAEMHLLLFPAGRVLLLPVGGATAAATDVALVALILTWTGQLLAPRRRRNWRSSLAPFLSSPLVGVGVAPFLAEAADRLQGGAVRLWDARKAYLSVAGQCGLVGLGIAATRVWLAVTGALGGGETCEAGVAVA